MIEAALRALRAFGFNRAISYGVLARLWSVISGPVTILMVATNLSREQQGFYYTIGSLLAMQIFFELGLMTVIAQFASHEFSRLTWGAAGKIEGDSIARGRFLDLASKSVRWFAIAALLLVVILIPTGLLFLGREQGTAVDFAWRIPWILAVLGTAANLMAIPFFAVVMGSGDVVTVNHREMVGAVLGSCIAWVVLASQGGLLAVFAVTCGNCVVSWIYLIREKPELLKAVWRVQRTNEIDTEVISTISWWGEVWPMQWKIALTWVCGYFVFQLFNPVLFHYHGAVVAGQMGMTLNVSNALFAISLTWMNTRSPEFGRLVALQEWQQLDALFFKVLKQSLIMVLIGAFAGWAGIRLLQEYYPIGQRFVPAYQAALLFAAACVHAVVTSFGVYLRAHKKEPFAALAVVLGILQGGATWFFGMKYATFGVVACYLMIHLCITLPAAFFIWRGCRRRWHATGG